MNKIAVIIVNHNCLKFTQDLLADLSKQDDRNFDIILIDNNSTESGTGEYFRYLSNSTPHTIITNNFNKSLNKIWNEYAASGEYEYLSFLNNDIRIPHNFISDTVKILDKEKNVSCVIHATNHPDYRMVKNNLEYEILPVTKYVRQGWDFTVKTCYWTPIPSSLQFYCGDDFIYEMYRRKNLNVAVALSSPVIHYQGMTRKNSSKEVDNQIRGVALKDIEEYKRLGYPHIWTQLSPYSLMHPTYKTFTQELK